MSDYKPGVDLTPGVASALSPLVRRIVAPNPSLMTGPGTNTYLVGIDEVAVIDPGPRLGRHIDSIVGASMRERVRWVLLTHTHDDHAPAAARLKELTGAEILGFSKRNPYCEVDDTLGDGDTVEGTEWGLEVLHTPGHASDHLCFLLEEERVLFTGDHIMQGSTVVIAPPDGDMGAYLQSLERLRRLRRVGRICPGHGEVIDEPAAVIDEYLRHRRMREGQVLEVLGYGPAKIDEIVDHVYRPEGLPDALVTVAAQQVHAHLIKLKADGKVYGRDARGAWKLA